MLKVIVYCSVHEDAPAIPADEFLTLAYDGETNGQHKVLELDASDLYCTGGTGEHQFIASVYADTDENRLGDHVDGRGIDVII